MRRLLTVLLFATFGHPPAQAASRTCTVPEFHGMAQPGGARVTIGVPENGDPCQVRYFLSLDPRKPYDRTTITSPPRNGVVRVEPSALTYQPRPGFVGVDAFSVIGTGTTIRGVDVTGHLDVQVNVVRAP